MKQRELFKKANENDRNKIDKISGIKSPLCRIISKQDTAEKEFIDLRQFNRNYTNIKSKKKKKWGGGGQMEVSDICRTVLNGLAYM